MILCPRRRDVELRHARIRIVQQSQLDQLLQRDILKKIAPTDVARSRRGGLRHLRPLRRYGGLRALIARLQRAADHAERERTDGGQ